MQSGFLGNFNYIKIVINESLTQLIKTKPPKKQEKNTSKDSFT